jgi:hypothetical protein
LLAFLFVDVFEHAFEILEEAVEGSATASRSVRRVGLTALLGGWVRRPAWPGSGWSNAGCG